MKLPKAFSSSASLSLLPNSADLRVLRRFSRVHSLRPHGLYPARLLRSWNFPGKNTGVDCHFLLQGIFLTQESNLNLLHCLHGQASSLPLAPPGKSLYATYVILIDLKLLFPTFCFPMSASQRLPQKELCWRE